MHGAVNDRARARTVLLFLETEDGCDHGVGNDGGRRGARRRDARARRRDGRLPCAFAHPRGGDSKLTGVKPDRQGIVEIRTRAGARLSHRIHAVRGTADNPMPREEVEEKALDLLGPVLGSDRARALKARIWELEGLADVRELRPLLRA